MENKYGIYTCVIGAEAQEYAKLCLPSQQAYAKAVGANYYVLDEKNVKPEYPTSHFNLLSAIEHFLQSDHERFLYMDADIIIHKNTPNIFEELPEGDFYLRYSNKYSVWYDWMKKNQSQLPMDGLENKFNYYCNTGVILADKVHLQKIMNFLKPPYVVGQWGGEQGHVNWAIAQSELTPLELSPRWNFTRTWVDGLKGKSLQTAGVDKIEDIYFMHYAVPGGPGISHAQAKIIAIKNDRHIYGYLGYDNTQEGASNVNVGMVLLSRRNLQSIMNNRLDIEDNIGEGIHIHYKNLRLDFTIEDYIELAKAMDQSLTKYAEMAETV